MYKRQEYGIYRHCFDVPDTWKGKQISIVFEGVMTDAEVKINDVIAGPVHQGSFYRLYVYKRQLLGLPDNSLLLLAH